MSKDDFAPYGSHHSSPSSCHPFFSSSYDGLLLIMCTALEDAFVDYYAVAAVAAEKAQGAVEHVVLRRDDPENGLGPARWEWASSFRQDRELGEDEQCTLEVRLGADRASARGEEERREAEPRAGLGEQEERGGVGGRNTDSRQAPQRGSRGSSLPQHGRRCGRGV
jgi:hypothetical protein